MSDRGDRHRVRHVYAGAAGRWDPRRNTSAVHPVPHEASGDAQRALAAFARSQPRHAAWIAAGAPSITSEAEHVRWFGEPYRAPTRRRARTQSASDEGAR